MFFYSLIQPLAEQRPLNLKITKLQTNNKVVGRNKNLTGRDAQSVLELHFSLDVVRRQKLLSFNSQFDPELNNVFSTSERHQLAMNSSLYGACAPRERESTEVNHRAEVVLTPTTVRAKKYTAPREKLESRAPQEPGSCSSAAGP